MKSVILSGGTPPTKELLQEELKEECYIICADSGANCLYEYNIIPNYLIGDFDSIDSIALEYFMNTNCIVERYPVDKDYTDTQLALLKAKDLNVDKITFLGCTGNRLDHTFGNINLLKMCMEYNIPAVIRDNYNQVLLANHSVELTGEKGDFFSVIPYGTDITGLTIEGAKYPLIDYDLNFGESLTLSNEFMCSNVKISFDKGLMLIIKSIE